MSNKELKFNPGGQNLQVAVAEDGEIHVKIDGKKRLGETGSGKNITVAKGAMAGKTPVMLPDGTTVILSVSAYTPKG